MSSSSSWTACAFSAVLDDLVDEMMMGFFDDASVKFV